ncbi:hypothetical protein CXF85_09490 [Colwellia sp. 75C3]|uniref:hypothetical protein n=1 Tax=Colwellia sp. 75C3 TaxID=888425 RepID=UPI000C33F8A2|nr:hypothetical protein [Colwellia sp. 75C3]PKG83731.1 hypothetical protein CXF85_09490 [Colwellia sp. 75C3]
MGVNFSQFDESSVVILKRLALHFPSPTEIGFNDVFPESEAEIDKRAAHIGTLAFLRHEDLIAHDVGSASSFILTRKGIALFNEDIFQHIKNQLNSEVDSI